MQCGKNRVCMRELQRDSEKQQAIGSRLTGRTIQYSASRHSTPLERNVRKEENRVEKTQPNRQCKHQNDTNQTQTNSTVVNRNRVCSARITQGAWVSLALQLFTRIMNTSPGLYFVHYTRQYCRQGEKGCLRSACSVDIQPRGLRNACAVDTQPRGFEQVGKPYSQAL